MSAMPLIGWRLAEIAPLAAGTTQTDSVAREVLSHLDRSTTVTLRVEEDENIRTSRDGPGGGVPVKGRSIRFRVVDAAAVSYTPRDGDRLVSFKDRRGTVIDATKLVLGNVRRTGEGIMGATYYVADLSDPLPARRDD